ncbi:hypothetical protein [Bacillus sp. REN16]|uniref:hypothetical protein n=1 Tax=Bacillus sp. REN16 TaxID=2887296 RepID=UPI001E4D4064|nr:hypothetical protein [Bacillus sp. REN16]MCC3359137.1 hypothetical protein [Bacillus sp. REN16]
MNPTVSIIFEQKPEQWGLRGDPYLWDDLQTAFAMVPLPCSESQFTQLLKRYFEELTNHPFDSETDFFIVEKYAHGGISSGGISMEFWEMRALPLLMNRLKNENKGFQ